MAQREGQQVEARRCRSSAPAARGRWPWPWRARPACPVNRPGPDVDGDDADLVERDVGLAADELDGRGQRLGVAPAPADLERAPSTPSWPPMAQPTCSVAVSMPRISMRHGLRRAGARRGAAASARARQTRADRRATLDGRGRRRPSPKRRGAPRGRSRGQADGDDVAPLDEGDAVRRRAARRGRGRPPRPSARGGRRRRGARGRRPAYVVHEGERRAGDRLGRRRAPAAKPWANAVLPAPRSPTSRMRSPARARARPGRRRPPWCSSTEVVRSAMVTAASRPGLGQRQLGPHEVGPHLGQRLGAAPQRGRRVQRGDEHAVGERVERPRSLVMPSVVSSSHCAANRPRVTTTAGRIRSSCCVQVRAGRPRSRRASGRGCPGGRHFTTLAM